MGQVISVQDVPPLAGDVISRDAETRLAPEKLLAAWQEKGTKVLVLRGQEVLVRRAQAARGQENLITSGVWESAAAAPEEYGAVADAPAAKELFFLTVSELSEISFAVPAELTAGTGFRVTTAGPHYLGRVQGEAVFVVAAAKNSAAPAAGEWANPMTVAASLPAEQLPILGVANALLRWHEQSGFSSLSGIPTVPDWGGWRRTDAAGVEHFPRTDPAVIVLIEHAGKVLLGSNVLWEEGRYSLLAGFVEAGESLEQACVREVREEAGIEIGSLQYMASQPWPFPRSLMLGFRAKLAPGQSPAALQPDPEEIAQLRWFTPEEILHPAPGIILPGKLSIARWMLDKWANEAGSAKSQESVAPAAEEQRE